MRLSVIIPNYNYAKFLPAAIDSLLNQTEAVDEIIVVDDGSTDDSRNVINSYGDKIIALFQDNTGQAAAISKGFANATGDIICLLDSDDVFFPDKTHILKKIYVAHPQSSWVFHGLKHLTPDMTANENPDFPDNVNVRTVDLRHSMIDRGKLEYQAPATSGLTFRRDFISPLFPLPQASSIYISDHYIKFYAIAKGPGIDVFEKLGGQIIHGANLYTASQPDAIRARIFVNTAYALFEKMPELKKFSANIMGEGLVSAKKAEISHQVEEMAGKFLKHLSPFEFFIFKMKIALKLIIRNIH